MIKAAINGIRNSDHHPLLPFSAEQAATESKLAISVGAEAIHVHVWDNRGKESLAADDVTAFLKAIRGACPDIPVGISTGEWIVPKLEQRLELISAWDVLPDFASLNIHEEGFDEVAALLRRKNIGIEAGISDSTAAKIFSRWPDRNKCHRILLEPEESMVEAAIATVEAVEAILDAAAPRLPRLLHGLDATTWPMVHLAAKREYDTRIGFEDTATLPNGMMAAHNMQLVYTAFKVTACASGHHDA